MKILLGSFVKYLNWIPRLSRRMTAGCRITLFFLYLLLLFSPPVHATQPVSLDLQNTNTSDAIRMLAKFLDVNIVMSTSINGVVTLHLHQANPKHAFELLLASQGLAKWQIGNIWFVAPRAELIKRKQEELKWQTVWNDSLPLTTTVWTIKYGKAEDIAHLLQDGKESFLSKRGRVRVDARTNTLCVQDISENTENIRRLIRRIDIPTQQIVIEARLVSVDSDFERELGFSFSALPAAEENGLASSKMLPGQIGRYSIAVATLADGSVLDVKLAALENAGHAELISSPSLFTSNRQPASIEAGEEIPYQEVSESGGTAAVFKKAVLGLKVTPQVLPGNNVLLQLQINQDRPNNKMVLGVPTIRTRQIVTNVLVKSGHTVVLGGIYETNQEEGERRIPFISQMPLIGLLFKQKNTLENKRELLIFVTPKVMTSTHEDNAK